MDSNNWHLTFRFQHGPFTECFGSEVTGVSAVVFSISTQQVSHFGQHTHSKKTLEIKWRRLNVCDYGQTVVQRAYGTKNIRRHHKICRAPQSLDCCSHVHGMQACLRTISFGGLNASKSLHNLYAQLWDPKWLRGSWLPIWSFPLCFVPSHLSRNTGCGALNSHGEEFLRCNPSHQKDWRTDLHCFATAREISHPRRILGHEGSTTTAVGRVWSQFS